MTTKRKPAAVSRAIAKKVAQARRGDPASRQLALELAVNVSSVHYTSDYSAGMSGYRSSERRPTHEEAAKIVQTAEAFLAFLAA